MGDVPSSSGDSRLGCYYLRKNAIFYKILCSGRITSYSSELHPPWVFPAKYPVKGSVSITWLMKKLDERQTDCWWTIRCTWKTAPPTPSPTYIRGTSALYPVMGRLPSSFNNPKFPQMSSREGGGRISPAENHWFT